MDDLSIVKKHRLKEPNIIYGTAGENCKRLW